MKERNVKFDILRLIFCAMIVFYNSNKFIGSSVYFSKGWYIAVEFFFIVSGIFLMKMVDDSTTVDNKESNILSMFWKKIKNIWLLYLCSYFFAFVVIQASSFNGWKECAKTMMDSIGRIFLLEMAGDILGGYTLQGSWIISSLMLGSLVVLCIYAISKKWFYQIIAPLFVILFIGYFNQAYGQIHKIHEWTVFIYSGTIRAIAELLLGCICYKVGCFIKDKSFKKVQRSVLLLLECCCYVTVIVVSYYLRASSIDFLFLLLLAVAATLSYGVEIKSNGFFTKIAWLGKKLSLPIYLNHLWIIYMIKDVTMSMPMKIVVFGLSLAGSCMIVLVLKIVIMKLIHKYSIYRKRIMGITTY